MTVFDLDEVGTWFEFDDGGRIQLRSMTAEKHKEIRRATVKKRVDFKKVEGTPSRFDYEETNEDLASEMFWDFVIVDWEKFQDKSGKEIPCTTANKILLITKSAKFVKAATEFLKQLSESEAEEAKATEKN